MPPPLTAYRSLLTGTLLTAAILALASTPAHAWGRLGHQLVGRVAAERLSGNAQRMVRRLLQGGSLADNSFWADTILSGRRETAPWHYINIPLDQSPADWRPFCPPAGCILEALEHNLATLADKTQPDRVRAEALRFTIHFVGDLHMPLHVGDRGDRGGNDFPVTWSGRSTNLHRVWDSELINSAGLDYDAWFGRVRARARTLGRREVERGSIGDWATESHTAARDFAYRLAPGGDPGPDYVSSNLPRVEDRLARAGIRLGFLLNRALTK